MENGKENVLEKAKSKTLRKVKETNYQNPVVPEGYIHLEGSWKGGFVIQNQDDGSEFVWIPVGFLDSDGTFDGTSFKRKFGRRKFKERNFLKKGYFEQLNYDLIESVKKYGVFYIARYQASQEEGKLVFKKGNDPWVDINYYEAATVSVDYAKSSKYVRSCLTTGAAFDSVVSWILKSGAKTEEEVIKDSSSWGNYPKTFKEACINWIMPTGSKKKWSVLRIYDLAGNGDEWTSEQKGYSYLLRGGSYYEDADRTYVAKRDPDDPENCGSDTTFRAILYLK